MCTICCRKWHVYGPVRSCSTRVRALPEEKVELTPFPSSLSPNAVSDPMAESERNITTLTAYIKRCGDLSALPEGKLRHGRIITSGLSNNVLLGNLFLEMYGKCGAAQEALLIFNSLETRNVYSWNIMITAYARCEQLAAAFQFFHQMPERNLVSWTSIVAAYAGKGLFKEAMELFQQMPQRGDVSWNALIVSYARHGKLDVALELLNKMQMDGFWPRPSTFVTIFNASAFHEALAEGMQAHTLIRGTELESDTFIGNSLIGMYGKCGNVEAAYAIFKRISRKDVTSWNCLIVAYAAHGLVTEAVYIFQQMQHEGMVTIKNILSGSCGRKDGIGSEEETFNVSGIAAILQNCKLPCGKCMHQHMIKDRLENDRFLGNLLIQMYAKHGALSDALRFFHLMRQRNCYTWNIMISGYVQCGQLEEAIQLFEQMPERDIVSWTTMITAYAQHGLLDRANEMFKKMPHRNIVSWNAMIAAYAQEKQLDEAFQLFQQAPERNVISWTSMIAGYAVHGMLNEAICLFRKMWFEGIKPNLATFLSVLNACASQAALAEGKQMHTLVINLGLEPHIMMGNALVDLYSKCGSLKDASRVFDTMHQRDVVSWNALVAAYAHHGKGGETLCIFEQMQMEGAMPDGVTCVSILQACTHAGLVEQGGHNFVNIIGFYGITPTLEHYTCSIDLFSRIGWLDEAEDLILSMPFCPDDTLLSAFLASCKHEDHVMQARHIFALLPVNVSICFLPLDDSPAAAGVSNELFLSTKACKEVSQCHL